MSAATEAWTGWHPMAFGRRPARSVRNPVIEPRWRGRRVLVRIEDGAEPRVQLRDEAGLALAPHPALGASLVEATGGASLVLDGYLEELPPLGAATLPLGPDLPEPPSFGEIARQLTFGQRLRGGGGRGSGRRRVSAASAWSPGSGSGGSARPARPGGPGGPGGSPVDGAAATAAGEAGSIEGAAGWAFVAVDLLVLDGEPILDVPLLERKRLLDSVVTVGDVVRRTPHVRPPAEAWYRQWRAFGFREVAVKDANGRYRPGASADDWTIATIPEP